MRKNLPWQRIWELREHPDRPVPHNRWVATVTLYSQSFQELARFRLHNLQHTNVSSCRATNKTGNCVFVYNRTAGGHNCNCFVDNLYPSYGSWWFWPMNEILDYDTLDDGAQADIGSLL